MGSTSITGSGHTSSPGHCPLLRPETPHPVCLRSYALGPRPGAGASQGLPKRAQRSSALQSTQTPQDAPQSPRHTPIRCLDFARCTRTVLIAPTPEHAALSTGCPIPHRAPPTPECTPIPPVHPRNPPEEAHELSRSGDFANKGPSWRLGVRPAHTAQAVSPSGRACHSRGLAAPLAEGGVPRGGL